MKRVWLLSLAVLLISTVSFPIVYFHYIIGSNSVNEDFFFGISFGSNNVTEAKRMINKVKDYTNLILINNYDLIANENETAFNEICQYAVDSDMYFMVFFDWISRTIYPWHQTWLDTAKERFGEKFLGVHLYDEPGGKQIEIGHWNAEDVNLLENVSDYSEAAEVYVSELTSTNSAKDLRKRNIPVFTSDYALYWFDYLADYDAVFVELGWNHSITKHIALDRGAANVQNKDWGAIIVWTYRNPPYIASGDQILEEMITAYRAGAKYVVIFNFPHEQPYGILDYEHFAAMETFWNMTHSSNHDSLEKVKGEAAFVLPKDYGWGMRWQDDRIWQPEWGPDNQSQLIWDNMKKLIDKYGLRLDIIYNDTRFDFTEKYSEIYYWNSVIE
jgi:hypothetical protein